MSLGDIMPDEANDDPNNTEDPLAPLTETASVRARLVPQEASAGLRTSHMVIVQRCGAAILVVALLGSALFLAKARSSQPLQDGNSIDPDHGHAVATDTVPVEAAWGEVTALDADGYMGPASTTRYWDCAYQHCYQFMMQVPHNMERCSEPTRFLNLTMGPDGKTNFFAHPEVGLWMEDERLYGTAAVSRSLGVFPADEGSPGCGKCYSLRPAWGAAVAKEITVMATNFCPECNEGENVWHSKFKAWHFDFAIPGGGMGLAPNCQVQYPQVDPEAWLVKTPEGCKALPQELQYSCDLGVQWLRDYPDVMFKEVACPSVLLNRLGCHYETPEKFLQKGACDCKWSMERGACSKKGAASHSPCWVKCCTPF